MADKETGPNLEEDISDPEDMVADEKADSNLHRDAAEQEEIQA